MCKLSVFFATRPHGPRAARPDHGPPPARDAPCARWPTCAPACAGPTEVHCCRLLRPGEVTTHRRWRRAASHDPHGWRRVGGARGSPRHSRPAIPCTRGGRRFGVDRAARRLTHVTRQPRPRRERVAPRAAASSVCRDSAGTYVMSLLRGSSEVEVESRASVWIAVTRWAAAPASRRA